MSWGYKNSPPVAFSTSGEGVCMFSKGFMAFQMLVKERHYSHPRTIPFFRYHILESLPMNCP